MSELTMEELNEGKKVLKGPTIFFWVIAILVGLGLFTFNMQNWSREFFIGPLAIGFPAPNISWAFLALYVVELVGLNMRKCWAVPLGRAGLVVAMVIFFPVGTIFGAILWKRFNDPIAKKYLGCMVEETKKEIKDEEKK